MCFDFPRDQQLEMMQHAYSLGTEQLALVTGLPVKVLLAAAGPYRLESVVDLPDPETVLTSDRKVREWCGDNGFLPEHILKAMEEIGAHSVDYDLEYY